MSDEPTEADVIAMADHPLIAVWQAGVSAATSPDFREAFSTVMGRHEFVKAEDCGCSALDRVPPDVLAKAKAIRGYLMAKGELSTQ